MKHKIVLEIDGVRHKLIKTRNGNSCKKCSLKDNCPIEDMLSCLYEAEIHFRKCKPGE